MGLFPSSEFKDAHVLHYPKFCDNKLFVYLPARDKFYTFSIFEQEKKYKFYGQATISTSSGNVFLIGGKTIHEPTEDDELLLEPYNSSPNLSISNFVTKINLKKHDNFKINLESMKPCRVLPEPRCMHLLVYVEPYIYVIGGEVPKTGPTKSCLKFHTKKRTWEKISDLTFGNKLIDACGVHLNDSIYVFDTAAKADFPRVHRYCIEVDQWMEILIHPRNRGLVVPPSLGCSAYQIADKQIMILGGLRANKDDKDKRGYYYIFDALTEEIRDFTYQEGISHWKKETQGMTNYVNSDVVYSRLSETSVKMFNKKNKKWDELRLISENTYGSHFGCCSRKK